MDFSCIEIKSIINVIRLDLIKLLMSLPFILLIIVMIFKDNIKNFIDDLDEAEYKGNKFKKKQSEEDVGKDETILKDSNLTSVKNKSSELKHLPPYKDPDYKKVIIGKEREIVEELKESIYKKEEVLIRDLARNILTVKAEKTYRLIFGSQIKLLQKAKEGAVSIQKTKKLYKKTVRVNKKFYKGFSFEEWISFCEDNAGLIKKQKQSYVLTDWGVSFLSYLIKQGYFLDKLY